MSKLALLGGPSVIQSSKAAAMNPWAYQDLEEAFTRYTGARYALAVGNGTAATAPAGRCRVPRRWRDGSGRQLPAKPDALA